MDLREPVLVSEVGDDQLVLAACLERAAKVEEGREVVLPPERGRNPTDASVHAHVSLWYP